MICMDREEPSAFSSVCEHLRYLVYTLTFPFQLLFQIMLIFHGKRTEVMFSNMAIHFSNLYM